MEKENLLKLFVNIIFLILTINIYSEYTLKEIYYKFKTPRIRGNTVVKIYYYNDSILLHYKTQDNWKFFTLNTYGIINKNPLTPLSIRTSFNSLFKRYKGRTVFNDTLSIYYQNNDSTIVKGDYQTNDWTLLPFYLIYYDDTIYKCTLLQGDIVLKKDKKCDTIIWKDINSDVFIKIIDSLPVHIKSEQAELIKK